MSIRMAPWLIVAFAASAGAGDFPSVDQLPSRPELPDPLVMLDGTPVKTPEQWFERRRPEIRALFEHYMYGKAPPAPKVAATVVRRVPDLFNKRATLDEVTLSFGPPGTPPIHLLLVVPTKSAKAPAFVAMNFCGNHEVLDDPQIQLPPTWMPDKCPGCEKNAATDAGRGKQASVWAIENAIGRGYAIATYYTGDIDPDRPDFTDGVHPHFFRAGQTKPAENDWGTIAAWAWGISRVVDYLQTRSDIDATRIGVTGHSRLGKTALLAAAFDERIAIAAPHQSGTGGCALSRANDQETVERINRVFPHWFNDEFTKFAGREDRLPIDQHLLMCLVAPRPIIDTEGVQDLWANYNNSLRALQAADKLYKFLSFKGLQGTGLVRDGESLSGPNVGDLVQCRLNTKHQLSVEYWNKIFDFADGYYARRKNAR